MANMCYNTLEISGKKKNKDRLMADLKKLFASKEYSHGEILPCMQEGDYMFFMDIWEDYNISFETKWCQIDPQDITRIAQEYNVNLLYTYEEKGEPLYGVHIVSPQINKAFDLDRSEIDFEEDDNGIIEYKDEYYESWGEVCELILREKFPEIKKYM